MRAVNPEAGSGDIRIGAQLRACRLAQNLTLEQLAEATGVTRGFLSRLERDATSPSLATLLQICEALSISIGSLFEPPEVQRIALDDAPRINMGGQGALERQVTPRSESRVQLIRSSLAPNASGGEALYTVNCDLEVLHVVSGALHLRLSDREERLVTGDTLTFPGRSPHTWTTGTDGAEVLWALIPAAWSGSN